jgi:hypothetical protein
MGRQRRCRLCHKRPPWAGKNCPPGVCRRCYHRHIWPERPAARAERRAAAALDADIDDQAWIDSLAEPADDVLADLEAADDTRQPGLPPWPIRRVTSGMKRCPLPEAEQLAVLFGDLLSDEPDPWAELDVDLIGAIQAALAGGRPLFVVVAGDDSTPHYGRITVTRGQVQLLLWEGGGSVCDETLAATDADAVLAAARDRARRLVAAYPTRPDVEAELAELLGASADPWAPDPGRRCTKHRASPTVPRRCAGCRAKREQAAATAKRLRAQAARRQRPHRHRRGQSCLGWLSRGRGAAPRSWSSAARSGRGGPQL